MGNHRFRLSDMMPNAWFHKLRAIGRASGRPANKSHSGGVGGSSTPKPRPPLPPAQTADPPYIQPRRASYYISSRQEKSVPDPGSPVHPRASDTLFPLESPRKSKKTRRKLQPPRPSHKPVSSVSTSGWPCRATLDTDVREGEIEDELPATDVLRSPSLQRVEDDDGGGIPCFDKLIVAEHDCDEYESVATRWPQTSSWNLVSPVRNDVAIMTGEARNVSSSTKCKELNLPPILTKPSNKEAEKRTQLVEGCGNQRPNSATTNSTIRKLRSLPPTALPSKGTQKSSRSGKRPTTPPATGIRMRANSPRLASKLVRVRAQRSRIPRGFLSESLAVVKSSANPQRDFRESMMEMISENNIRRSKDLEDLLACYLSLNSDEYHDVIVSAFEQIWFDLNDAGCRDDPQGQGCARRR